MKFSIFNKKKKFQFKIRPGYQTTELLIEFMGDHRAKNYPDLIKILKKEFNASHVNDEMTSNIFRYAMTSDHFIWKMHCDMGEFVVNDDWCGLTIFAEGQNQPIIFDIEKVLMKTGYFEKIEVDFNEYK